MAKPHTKKESGNEDDTERENDSEKFEKKELMYILIPVLIILIIFGILFSVKYFYKEKPNAETIDYNGFIFTKLGDNMWTSQVKVNGNLYSALFKYNPEEVENITVNYLPNNFTGITKEQDKLYISFDPESANLAYIALASTDISYVLSKVYDIQAIGACARNLTQGCADRPIQNCSTTGRVVISIKDDPVQNITYSENCLTIQGNKDDLLKASTRVIMEWYGIIKPEE
jgi:hypothetical protein